MPRKEAERIGMANEIDFEALGKGKTVLALSRGELEVIQAALYFCNADSEFSKKADVVARRLQKQLEEKLRYGKTEFEEIWAIYEKEEGASPSSKRGACFCSCEICKSDEHNKHCEGGVCMGNKEVE